MRPPSPSLPHRSFWGTGIIVALTAWALLVHPQLGGDALGGSGSSNSTITISTTTSSETVTTNANVRVDTFATRLVVIDPIGGQVSDETLPLPFADPTVQSTIAAARAAPLAGPPASLFVKGPSLAETNESLVGSERLGDRDTQATVRAQLETTLAHQLDAAGRARLQSLR